MIPFSTLLNAQGVDVGAIVFPPALSSPWVSLLADTPDSIAIPSGAIFVRFAYDLTGANVYVAPDDSVPIVIPTAGSTEFSSAETNPSIRVVEELVAKGITTLNIVSDATTTVHIYFYTR